MVRYARFVARGFALSAVALTFAYLADTYLTFGRDWPGSLSALTAESTVRGWLQLALYPVPVGLVLLWVYRTPATPLHADAARLGKLAAFIVRAGFWTVLIVGSVDALISFLRVEEYLVPLFGETLTTSLGVSSWRGYFVHIPLLALAIVIGARGRTLAFPWLVALVVAAEFGIVIARFVFSYEQAFMGDLVRFWYAALFLFASAQTLLDDGHVRVDVLYAGFSERGKAWTNLVGSLLLGMPLCATILVLGLADKTSIIASPVLSFETTQSGFGLYVKYMMAAYLGLFAISMLIQFSAMFLTSVATVTGEADPAGESTTPPVDATVSNPAT